MRISVFIAHARNLGLIAGASIKAAPCPSGGVILWVDSDPHVGTERATIVLPDEISAIHDEAEVRDIVIFRLLTQPEPK